MTTTEANEDYWRKQDEAIAATRALIEKGLRRRKIAQGSGDKTAPFSFNFIIPRATGNARY